MCTEDFWIATLDKYPTGIVKMLDHVGHVVEAGVPAVAGDLHNSGWCRMHGDQLDHDFAPLPVGG